MVKQVTKNCIMFCKEWFDFKPEAEDAERLFDAAKVFVNTLNKEIYNDELQPSLHLEEWMDYLKRKRVFPTQIIPKMKRNRRNPWVRAAWQKVVDAQKHFIN